MTGNYVVSLANSEPASLSTGTGNLFRCQCHSSLFSINLGEVREGSLHLRDDKVSKTGLDRLKLFMDALGSYTTRRCISGPFSIRPIHRPGARFTPL